MAHGEALGGATAFKLLFEAEQDGTRFFQVAVVAAPDVWAAQGQLERHLLSAHDAVLLWVDPEETREVALPPVPAGLQEDAGLGVVELSGRMTVVSQVPPPAVRPAHAALH
jgi:hypothetical protein